MTPVQSFELQRVVEGEKAERTETARLLQEAKRRLAAAPPGRQTEGLIAKSVALQEKLRDQSAQVGLRPHCAFTFGCCLKGSRYEGAGGIDTSSTSWQQNKGEHGPVCLVGSFFGSRGITLNVRERLELEKAQSWCHKSW